MKKTLGKVLFFSLLIILAAQLSMNLFIADFKISIAVICVPVFLFLTEGFPLILVTICSAIGVFALRTLMYWFQYASLDHTAFFLPEAGFYICYGLLLFGCTRILKGTFLNKNLAVIPLIFIDYGANLAELLLRIRTDAFEPKAQAGILLVALLRTAVIWCILTIFERYRLLLLKQEHEERYHRLLMLISKLDGEVIWMRKNTALIEETMRTSYKLFENLKSSGAEPGLTSSALSVAKDIHEIKKEYLLIMRGISEALDEELKSDGMHLEELLLLLKDAMALVAKEQDKELLLTLEYADNPYTDRHYALMSIFRNLFINAIEAAAGQKVRIALAEASQGADYIFSVTDYGMNFYLIDDDPNILNILKLIITNRRLGIVCGTGSTGIEGLEDIRVLKPDIVIVDLLMPEMDGISFVEKARPLLDGTAFIMLSQVSSKDMISSAYEAGIEFFIQKPINSVEVETVIQKVSSSLTMQRTLHKMQNIFMEDLHPQPGRNTEDPASAFLETSSALTAVLQRLGIIGDIGCKDIITIVEYLTSRPGQMNEATLNELCSKFSDSPKSMEQRIRRTANAGLVNLAHLGLEDYGNEIFIEYANTLYNFEQVRREMDYIRGRSEKHGNVKIRNFLNALVVYSMNN